MKGSRMLFALLAFLVACRSNPPAEPKYVPVEGAVGFDIRLVAGPSDMVKDSLWLASQTSSGHTARFRIEFAAGTPAKNSSLPLSFGKGKFLREPGSDATVLLIELKKALEANELPKTDNRAGSVPFEYVVLETKARREADGSFERNNTGNWELLKLFFGDDEGEVYLNLNSELGKAEFSIKDPDYGNFVLRELAKVL